MTRYDIDDLDRAIADGEAHGFVKVLTEPGQDRILGATIVGYHAAELLGGVCAGDETRHRAGQDPRHYPCLPHPGRKQQFLASEWRKARKPERLLGWVERYHRWCRG